MPHDENDSKGQPKITYTKEFLLTLKHLKLDPPESVIQFNDLYVYAPKPQAHRPRVDRSASRGTRNDFAKGFVSDSERTELQRKRREDDRVKQANKLARAKLKQSDGEKTCTLPVEAAKEDQPPSAAVDTIQSLLTDAQEQQALLSVPDPDGYMSSANKPEARSRIPRGKHPPIEESARRLEQRRKQLGYGYVTHGYLNYIKLVPKEMRKDSDPKTPNAMQVCSKRSWDGQLALWRRLLHRYDVEGLDTKTEEPSKRMPSSHFSAEEREELAKMRLAATRGKGQEKKDSPVKSTSPVDAPQSGNPDA